MHLPKPAAAEPPPPLDWVAEGDAVAAPLSSAFTAGARAAAIMACASSQYMNNVVCTSWSGFGRGCSQWGSNIKTKAGS